MYVFAAWAAFTWFFLVFCDTIFKTCMFHPYYKALHLTGLDIKPLMISLRISRYNRFINQMGRWKPLAFMIWFDIGAVTTAIIAVPCLMLYVFSLYQIYNSLTVEDYNSSLLLPVIPGYNFPFSHWIYYISVILLCSVVHEFGHALAASRERISIENFGFGICAIIPLAFVNLRFDQFRNISKWQQMRIVSAGIWHNIVLALFALLFSSFLTTALSPLYSVGYGVAVLGVNERSGLNHPAGFEIGDKIYGIEDCNVKFQADWNYCLKDAAERPQRGLCIPENTYSKPIETCRNSSGYLHFQAPKEEGYAPRDLCLHARQAIESFSRCNKTSECKALSLCTFPVLSSKAHRLVTIKRYNKPIVLYDGPIEELFADVQVSHFIQKYKLFPTMFAEIVQTFLGYIIIFSCGLACLNILPVLAFDGQFIIELLIHFWFAWIIPRYDVRRTIFLCVNKFAFGLLSCLTLLTGYKFYVFGF